MIRQETLKSGDGMHTIWQTDKEDGVPETALQIKEYSGGGVLEIRQDKMTIMVNMDTLPELIKVLRHYQQK